jgi:hypothetical protein
MKGSTLIGIIFGAPVLVVVTLLLIPQKPLADIPQENRCAVMCDRRDSGSISNLEGKTKQEIRKILGDPQNIDAESNVWIWLFDWSGYIDRGLSRDWKTMSENSGGSDGLWIGFDEKGRVRTPLWSLSAATPPGYRYKH